MGGFECEFLQQPREIQTDCPVCLQILHEPYQVTCCGKSYCKDCIQQIKDKGATCPTCNEKDFSLYPNKGLQQSLYSFKVHCPHQREGCMWTGELGQLDKHLNENEDRSDESSDRCCQFAVTCCDFESNGCKIKLPRRDMATHMNTSASYHIQLLLSENQSLKEELTATQRECKSQKEQNEVLKHKLETLRISNRPGSVNTALSMVTSDNTPTPPVEFTMTNYEWYKSQNEGWYSPSFYTHPHGYKMCLRVDANGLNQRKGTVLISQLHSY